MFYWIYSYFVYFDIINGILKNHNFCYCSIQHSFFSFLTIPFCAS